MNERWHKYLIMLVGTIFLLHTVVPHHHHADAESFVEHFHLVEHANGMHDEEDEKQHHHHHHENVVDEIMIASATLQHYVNWHSVLMPFALCGESVQVPVPSFISIQKSVFNYVSYHVRKAELITDTRGPPSVC